jgi:arsenite methyltransferase
MVAYIGCLSGAISKNEYLKALKAAGFKDVKIVDESIFPLEDMANDPAARTIMDSMKMTREQLTELANSVASIKVSARKPG